MASIWTTLNCCSLVMYMSRAPGKGDLMYLYDKFYQEKKHTKNI